VRLHPQRDDFLTRVLDLPENWITPFDGVLFRFIGIEVLIAPSAASDAGTNVVIFPENLRHPDEFFVEREVLLH
jgi:hypothetical protein